MPSKDVKWNRLDQVLDNIWRMLTRGAVRGDDPFHWPVLGTTAKEGCRLRTVILRQVSQHDRTLVCHTDARSAKVKELRNETRTSWIFYHPQRKIQLRVSGRVTLHTDDPTADRQWTAVGVTSRLNYCTVQTPGTPIDKPSSGLPAIWRHKMPALLDTERGRKHFMAIVLHIDAMDWLILRVTGNRRARFEWDEQGLQATWLVP